MTLSDRLFDALALAVLLVFAAVLQQGLGPWAWGLAKPPFLLAIAAYYAQLRPMWLAVPASFCAGAWADGLGSAPGCPIFVASLALLAFSAFCGRQQLTRSLGSCVFVGTVAVLAATLLQALTLAMAPGGLPDAVPVFAARLVCQTALAVPTILATALFARAFERLAGNIDSKKGEEVAHDPVP